MAANSRSLLDVEAVLEKAKLSVDEFMPMHQYLEFSQHFKENDLLLLEMDSKLLDELLKNESFSFRGEKSDEAVLCTSANTYEVKEAEISNALLLTPNLVVPDQIDSNGKRIVKSKDVIDVKHEYFELRPCKPRLKKLRQLLENNLYCGETYESENNEKFNIEKLLQTVQASEAEIVNQLIEMNACYIKGYWRLLDHEYHFRVFNLIIEYIDANFSIDDKISKNSVIEALQDLEPRAILDQIFSWYSDKIDSSEGCFYKLNEVQICRFYAEVLLRPADKFVLNEFLEVWQNSIPDGMNTNLSYIENMCLIDSVSTPSVIWFFPIYELPEDIKERFDYLFKVREKWKFEEITPFVRDLATDKLTVNAMLTKFARTSTKNGVKYFNSKRIMS